MLAVLPLIALVIQVSTEYQCSLSGHGDWTAGLAWCGWAMIAGTRGSLRGDRLSVMFIVLGLLLGVIAFHNSTVFVVAAAIAALWLLVIMMVLLLRI